MTLHQIGLYTSAPRLRGEGADAALAQAEAWAQLGPDAHLIPEVKVVLESDPDVARAAARKHLAIYLGLENYLGNLRRMGFTDSDLAAPGSDRLIDALVAHGGLDAAAARVEAHLAAGANGVAIHVLDPEPFPVHAWTQLADALELGR